MIAENIETVNLILSLKDRVEALQEFAQSRSENIEDNPENWNKNGKMAQEHRIDYSIALGESFAFSEVQDVLDRALAAILKEKKPYSGGFKWWEL